MENINSINISINPIRSEAGTIDLEKTLTAVAEYLTLRAEQEKRISEGVSVAVHAVFEQYKGKTLAMPAAINYTVGVMGVPLDQYAETAEAIGEWIRHSPEFKIAKGKGGGVSRICDAVEKEEKPSKKK